MENEHLKKGALVFQGFLSLFPAYAGVIPSPGLGCCAPPAFPRIRGGDPEYGRVYMLAIDFSPHTRG